MDYSIACSAHFIALLRLFSDQLFIHVSFFLRFLQHNAVDSSVCFLAAIKDKAVTHYYITVSDMSLT